MKRGMLVSGVFKNKRAQFFLVGAFIIIAILVGISKINNYIISPVLPFSRGEVNRELDREAHAAVNYAIHNNRNVNDLMEGFSKDYVAYSRAKMPDSQYFFLYADAEEVALFAFGDGSMISANMSSDFSFVSGGDDFLKSAKARSGDQVNVTFYDRKYVFSLKERDFKHIVRVENERGLFIV